jgi:SAM-dependent methyltransferase
MTAPSAESVSSWTLLGRLLRDLVTQPKATLGKHAKWHAQESIIAPAIHAERIKRESREFELEYRRFEAMLEKSGRSIAMGRDDVLPCPNDRSKETPFDPHYTYHPAWAARVLARTRPAKHVDISSILSFAAVVSAFVPVDFYDFRPASIKLDGLRSGATDICRLEFADGSIASLSCMHVIEHIGLGRYGDPLDANGDLNAIGELMRVLAPGGNLLIAVPVGRERVQFNAHRIYDFTVFRSYFANLELVEFALIPDEPRDGLIYDSAPELVRTQSYGCGCFWFRKPNG